MTDLNSIHLYEPTMATGDEKALLRTHLALAQNHLLWKLEGLTDEELRRPMTKTSTNLIGIVKHLTGVTAHYLISSFGRDREFFEWELGDDPEFWYGGDMWAAPEESPGELVAAYRRACDAALESIDALDLDTVGTHHTGLKVSLRWMILNVLSDTLRHLGHADVLRENIDGSVGVDPVLSNTIDGGDDEYWAKFRQRVTGELTREEWMSYAEIAAGLRGRDRGCQSGPLDRGDIDRHLGGNAPRRRGRAFGDARRSPWRDLNRRSWWPSVRLASCCQAPADTELQ